MAVERFIALLLHGDIPKVWRSTDGGVNEELEGQSAELILEQLNAAPYIGLG